MYAIDLTTVGFTPTESAVYSALLDRGPSSGYAVGKVLGIARANAYQALNGLVTKGAALAVDHNPQRFRAVGPETLLALVVERETGKLDKLEREVRQYGALAEPGTVWFDSERQFEQLALRTATRAPGEVMCIGPARLLQMLRPIWRRRQADGAPTALWSLGGEPAAGLELAGTVSREVVAAFFPADPVLMTTGTAAIAGLAEGDTHGFWTSEPLVVGAIRATGRYLSGK